MEEMGALQSQATQQGKQKRHVFPDLPSEEAEDGVSSQSLLTLKGVWLWIVSTKNSQAWGQQDSSVSKGDCPVSLPSEFNPQDTGEGGKLGRREPVPPSCPLTFSMGQDWDCYSVCQG